jgi:hypothetical protein
MTDLTTAHRLLDLTRLNDGDTETEIKKAKKGTDLFSSIDGTGVGLDGLRLQPLELEVLEKRLVVLLEIRLG